MRKFLFILFHVLLAALMVTFGVIGALLMNYIFKFIGILIVLVGILSFFPNLVVKFVYDDAGNEWMVTNISHRLIMLFTAFVIGALIYGLMDYVSVPRAFGALGIFLLAQGVGYKIAKENDNYYAYDISDATRTAGRFVPLVYTLGGGVFLLSTLVPMHPAFCIAAMSAGAVFHFFRMVLVLREESF